MIQPTLLSISILLLLPHVHSLSITPTTQSSNIIRGSNKYGTNNNSTILTPSDAAQKVGVLPTKNATKGEWQRAWKLHRGLMKPLHLMDGCRPKDSKLALACLWWKALAGNDKSSPVHDYSLSYDLLPPITRWIVSSRVCRFYPRLHHANVEIRTAYLDKALTNIINTIMNDYNTAAASSSTQQQHQSMQKKKKKKIRLVVMGGGYDTRSIKLLEQSLLMQSVGGDTATSTPYNLLQRRHGRSQRRRRRWYHRLLRRNNNRHNSNDDDSITSSAGNAFINITNTNYNLEAYELDLPEVVTAKRKLLLQRLFRRRPWLQQRTTAGRMNTNDNGQEEEEEKEYPILMEANFNDLNATRKVLEGILLNNDDESENEEDVTNIVLFEGVMIYLDEGIPHALLELCSDVLKKSRSSGRSGSSSTTAALGYLCFADRLENIPGGDEDAAQLEMECTGWELVVFLSKPGLARHMGVARVVV
mmetsp:Transcript_3330/g.5575  ORF Transcript_3330/g.5575 Transcript_3330/m.5575 type:complete len:474 (-) Transcript_3330:271-1692(-)